MAKTSANRKSLFDFFKINENDEDYNDDLFDEDEDDDEDLYDDVEQPKQSAPKQSPFTSFKNMASATKNSSSSSKPQTQAPAPRPVSRPAQPQQPSNKLVAMNSDRSMEPDNRVVVVKPVEFNNAQRIVDYLNDDNIVVINMEGFDVPLAQRIIDFVAGACFALDGSLQAITGNIFIATPNGIYIEGDLREQILGETASNNYYY